MGHNAALRGESRLTAEGEPPAKPPSREHIISVPSDGLEVVVVVDFEGTLGMLGAIALH